MKNNPNPVLRIAAIEALHFVILTGLLCGIGFFTLDGETRVTFAALLWTGTVSFWFDGFGPVLLLCLVLFIGRGIWEFFADREAFEKRKKDFDQEVALEVRKRVEVLRPKLSEAIERDFEEIFAAQERTLFDENVRLARQQKELENARGVLAVEWDRLREEREKVHAWRVELEALRRKAAVAKEEKSEIKRRVQWAIGALGEQSFNVGLALRHLKKAEKM